MAGFFDQGYNSPDPGLGTGNNAANDFAALNAANPGQFESPFKKKSRKETIDATQVDPNPAPAPAVVTAQDRLPPAISSAPALVKRITQNSNPATALVPGTNMTASEYAASAVQEARAQAENQRTMMASLQPPQAAPQLPVPQQPRQPMAPNPMSSPTSPQLYSEAMRNPGNGQMNLPPYNMASMGPPPAPRQQPSPYGNQTFGGNTFGGNKFGASSLPLQGAGLPGQTPAAGYFSGGPIHMMHGGYPQLAGLSGMPERHFASGGPDGNFVPGDGKGDGRSDHVKAMLSPGEFVMDAESTSLLGNGDSDAGARGMEAIRKEIREHKGKALAKGKFSPDAPSPKKLARIGMKAAS
jgi:hypothetical protein